jgi:hypothetical protein
MRLGLPSGFSLWIRRLDSITATDSDFLQLSLSEETDVTAIGRPEWILSVFGSR